ncbi:MAG: hypothetical protein LBT14_03035 [Treponema sp.]|nr:hypothetical protein [Treponema sp.]
MRKDGVKNGNEGKNKIRSCALLAFLNKEGGWDKVKNLLIEAIDTDEVEIYMNIVNLREVYYDRLRLDDSGKLDEFLAWAFPNKNRGRFPHPLP